jgi:Zn finger protein HypA/HybF involved in hydrogenase expression
LFNSFFNDPLRLFRFAWWWVNLSCLKTSFVSNGICLPLKPLLEKTNLSIQIVRAEQQCMVCFLVYHPNEKETACPQCKSVGAKIIKGEEFYFELD